MLPSDRREAQALALARDPRDSELWFQNLPENRRSEMVEEYRTSLRRTFEMRLAERDRAIREAACMGGAFLIADVVCPGGSFFSALGSLVLGGALGYTCNRLDTHQVVNGILGVFLFLISQYVLLDSVSMFHAVACLPLGVFFALLGFQREARRAF